ELPFGDIYVHIRAMYRSITHRMPVANGYAGYIPPTADVIEWALRRHDPSILTALRRGRPLYVVVDPSGDAESWTRFMEAQPGAELRGVSAEGRIYRMPPAPVAPEVTFGAELPAATRVARGDWLVADL